MPCLAFPPLLAMALRCSFVSFFARALPPLLLNCLWVIRTTVISLAARCKHNLVEVANSGDGELVRRCGGTDCPVHPMTGLNRNSLIVTNRVDGATVCVCLGVGFVLLG